MCGLREVVLQLLAWATTKGATEIGEASSKRTRRKMRRTSTSTAGTVLKRGYATKSFRGIFPPITTPFVSEGPKKGDVDKEALARNVDRYFQTDLHGLVVLGSNGEFPLLSYDEKVDVFKTVKEVAARHEKNGRKKLLIAGTGTVNTRDTITLTKEAHRIGFDAAMVVTPYYYTDHMKDNMLRSHLESVATNSEIPIILYNVPPLAGGVKLSIPLITELAKHPNIVGIKDTTGSIVNIAQLVQRIKLPLQQRSFPGAPAGKEDFFIFAGSGSYLLQALSAGADGGVNALANILPSTVVHLWNLYQKEEFHKAEKLQGALVEVNQAVTAQFGTAGAKRAMDVFGVYKGGDPRSPLLPLGKSEIDVLETVLKATRTGLSAILPPEVKDW